MGKVRWLPPPFETGREKYLISDDGRVYKQPRKSIAKYGFDTKGKFISIQITKKGYCRVSLLVFGKKKHFYTHRLIGLTFIKNPHNKPCINHKDGNKKNNHYSNLEWCTEAENNEHGFQMGLLKRGRTVRSYIRKGRAKGFKTIKNIFTGDIFPHAAHVVEMEGYKSRNYFCRQLRGERPNLTPYRYA